MLEEIIILLLVVVIALMLYFNSKNNSNDEDFNIQSIKDVQVEIKDKIIERDTLDLKSIEKAKESSESEAKILREELKSLKELIENERTSTQIYASLDLGSIGFGVEPPCKSLVVLRVGGLVVIHLLIIYII